MRAADKLVDHFKGKREAADALGIHEETLRLWLRDGIPLAKAIEVEQKSKRVVTAEQILRAARQTA